MADTGELIMAIYEFSGTPKLDEEMVSKAYTEAIVCLQEAVNLAEEIDNKYEEYEKQQFREFLHEKIAARMRNAPC